MTIWTIGHSTRTFTAFLHALQSQQIKALADVRGLPGSRRFPQFDQSRLMESLSENGIDYHHFPALGGRRKARPDSRNLAWNHPAFRGYADYMETAEFTAGVAALSQLAGRQRTAMMCAEAVWWRCHRSLVSDYLKARGWTVLHIFDPAVTREHPYTSAAHLEKGALTYRQPRNVPP